MRRHLAFWIAVAGLAACGHQESSGPDLTVPAVLLVQPDSLALDFDDTARVRVVVLNAKGDTLPTAPVSFVSQDTSVATVDSGGLVHALGGGAIDVTITSAPIMRALRVHVRINGTLTVSPLTSFLRSGDTVQLTVVVKDSTGAIVANPSLDYRSPDTTVARVLSSGKVVFGGAAGTVIIGVSSEGRKDGAFVTAVVARVTGLTGSLVPGPIFALNSAGDLFAYRSGGGVGLFYRYLLPDTIPTSSVTRDITGVGTAAVDAGATRLYVGDDYFGTVTTMDVAADTVINVIDVTHAPFNPRPPYAMVVGPNGQLYYNADSIVSRLALDALSTTALFQFGRAYHTVIRDTLLYVSGDVHIREYNLRTGSLGRQFDSTRYAYDLALSANGTRLYHTTIDNTGLRIAVRDLTTGDTLPSMKFLGYMGPSDYSYTTLAVQPTTGLLWIVAGNARILVVDPTTARIVRELRPGGSPHGIAFAASGLGVLGNSQGWIDYIR